MKIHNLNCLQIIARRRDYARITPPPDHIHSTHVCISVSFVYVSFLSPYNKVFLQILKSQKRNRHDNRCVYDISISSQRITSNVIERGTYYAMPNEPVLVLILTEFYIQIYHRSLYYAKQSLVCLPDNYYPSIKFARCAMLEPNASVPLQIPPLYPPPPSGSACSLRSLQYSMQERSVGLLCWLHCLATQNCM